MDGNFGYYMKKISNQLDAGWNAALKSMGITGTQLRMLEYLYECTEETSSVSHISAYFGVKHTSVLHVLRLLEDKGYIVRGQAEKGRRSRPIRLTDSGIALVQRNENNTEIVDGIMFAGMTAQERQELLRLLKQVNDNLEKHNIKEI
ncbi:MAG: MarR family transcriptional regulator [Eubacteriales bacterium]|nr:MarR family transcriptional regulator [Eubacteriales bacterium]